MGGNPIKNLELLFDRIQLALESQNLERAQELVSQLTALDFALLDSQKVQEFLSRVDHLIAMIEAEKTKRFEALQQKESLKKYRF